MGKSATPKWEQVMSRRAARRLARQQLTVKKEAIVALAGFRVFQSPYGNWWAEKRGVLSIGPYPTKYGAIQHTLAHLNGNAADNPLVHSNIAPLEWEKADNLARISGLAHEVNRDKLVELMNDFATSGNAIAKSYKRVFGGKR